ncbi:MAG: hypothetical protein L0Y39_04140 [Methylococcaceae bacterium]|nr:hypothetical protein [Methylococcaceae bacterium]
MNEAKTGVEQIDPALAAAGWGVVEGSHIRREYPITLGRIEGPDKWDKPLTEGIEAGTRYGEADFNKLIEIKERGNRLYDGKDYFTIYDFVKAHPHFSDPDRGGEPSIRGDLREPGEIAAIVFSDE